MASHASSLVKGLELLGEEEARADGGLTVVRIATLAGREKSQVSGCCACSPT